MDDIFNCDCLEGMRELPADSVDAIVTDPPYGLNFMGKDWDHGVPGEKFWVEALRVAKPGAHLLAFGGTRTYHRLACAIEDAGWEIRDCLGWLYGSGFPKSMDVSKAIDKGTGENRARQLEFTAWMRSTGITAEQINAATGSCMANHYLTDKQQPAIAVADKFDLLRPYLPKVPERIERLVAERTGIEWTDYVKRPITGKAKGAQSASTGKYGGWGNDAGDGASEYDLTAPASDAAKQWQGWGTCLKPAWEPIIMARKPLDGTVAHNVMTYGTGAINIDACRIPTNGEKFSIPQSDTTKRTVEVGSDLGITKSSVEKFQASQRASIERTVSLGRFPANIIHDGSDEATAPMGDASRFFYCAKASKKDRGEGNNHPTVKPQALMQYLIKLVTPEGAVVLDPFLGSGSTAVAAMATGRHYLGYELSPEYFNIARARLDAAKVVDDETL